MPRSHTAHAARRPMAFAALPCPGTGLVRWALLWFALSLGVAVASPLVHPVSMELVCSASGSVKAIVHTDDGAQELGAGHLDCPLCMLGGVPPAGPAAALPPAVPAVHAAMPFTHSHVASIAAAPLPARGPPPLSS